MDEIPELFASELDRRNEWTICNRCTRLERYLIKVFLKR
jgi:hypothetical protein